MNDFEKEREEVATFMRRLYRQFLTTTSGGNISCRTPQGHILITASQSDKGEQTGKTVGIVTLQGENLTPHLKLSIETELHLAVYKARKDVHAIVHAHPVTATFFCTKESPPLNTRFTAEAYAVAGDAVKIPYALMGNWQNLWQKKCGLPIAVLWKITGSSQRAKPFCRHLTEWNCWKMPPSRPCGPN